MNYIILEVFIYSALNSAATEEHSPEPVQHPQTRGRNGLMRSCSLEGCLARVTATGKLAH